MASIKPRLIQTQNGPRFSCSDTGTGFLLFWVFVFFTFISSATFAAIELTEKERIWLEKHPEINLSSAANIQPVLFTDRDGGVFGIVPDLIKLIEQQVDLKVNLKLLPPNTQVEAMESNEVDALLYANNAQFEGTKFLNSDEVSSVAPVIFRDTKSDVSITGWNDLVGKRVVYRKDRLTIKDVLVPFGDSVEILPSASVVEAFKLLIEGKADVYVGYAFDSFQPIKFGLTGIEVAFVNTELTNEIPMFIVRQDWPELLSILNKILPRGGNQQTRKIVEKWINNPEITSEDVLTTEQRQWLNEKSSIRLGFADTTEPWLINNQGRLDGILVDIVDRINEELKTDIQIIVDDIPKLYPGVKTRQLDGLLLASENAVNALDTTLVDEKFYLPYAIFSSSGSKLNYSGPEDLKGKKIAYYLENLWQQSGLETVRESIQEIKVESPLAGFALVASGNADVFIGYISDNFVATKNNIPNIQPIYIETNPPSLSIAIRNDWPQLVDILNKGFELLGEDELASIQSKWINTQVNYEAGLSKAELDWLSRHPDIRLAFSDQTEPWLIKDGDNITGILPEIINAINEKMGTSIAVETSGISDIYSQVKQRELDGMLLTSAFETQPLDVSLTDYRFFIPRTFFVNAGSDITFTSVDDLKGKRIAYYDSSFWDYSILSEIKDDVEQVRVNTSLEGLALLAVGSVDVVAGYSSDNYLIETKNIPNLKPVYVEQEPLPLSISVRSDWPELLVILNKGLSKLGYEAIRNIQVKWLGSATKTEFLTKRDKELLQSLPALKYLYANDYPPLQFDNSLGENVGVLNDYKRLLSDRLGIEFEPIVVGTELSPMEYLQNATADFSIIYSRKEDSNNQLAFSDPLLSIPFVVVAPSDKPLVSSLNDLKGKVILSRAESAAKLAIAAEYGDDVIFKSFLDIKDAFESLASGEADYLIESEAFVDYKLRQLDITELRIAGKTPYLYEPVITLRKEYADLVPIINKALASISLEEKDLIYQIWNNQPVEKTVDWTLIITWLSITAIFVIAVLFVIVYWNRQLSAAKEKADQASRSKSIFLANMSHEIRTPMNAILGFTEMLKDNPDLSREERLELLDVIDNSGNHLLSIINDILDISKIEAGQMTLMPVECDLRSVLSDIEDMFKVRADQKGLWLKFSGIETLPQLVKADEGKVRQVVINIIGNAIKFTDKGGVNCNVSCDYVGGDRRRISIEVIDTGYGISEEDSIKVFSSFEQTYSGRKNVGGTGLGMSISRQYAQLMEGDIRFTSEVGRGSKFIFDFYAEPCEKVFETESFSKVSTIDLGGKNYSVLVVDDVSLNRMLVVKLLEPLGFYLYEAENGQEAVEVVKSKHVDLVLMDINMPIMDGVQATQRIRLDKDHQELPIIALTASVFEEQRAKIIDSGLTDYLSKPFKRDALFLLIAEYLGLNVVIDHGNISSPDENTNSPGEDSLYDSDDVTTLSTKKLLIVDDVPVNRMLLKKMMVQEGYECYEASNGREALEQLHNVRPDLVLLDIQMPVMNGYEVLAVAKDKGLQKLYPFVAVTAESSDGERKKLLDLGAAACCEKPIRKQELLNTIDKIFSEKNDSNVVKLPL